MRQKTIVYANTIDYDHPLQQRPMHLMNEFAKSGKYKVYYVNQTQRTDKVRDRINENLEVYHNWEVFKKRVPEVDIYFSSWSFRHVDLNEIKTKLVIYDSLDNFEQNEPEEINMINKADILCTTSDTLYDIRKHQHKNIHIVRNGCFPEMNKEYQVPEDLLPFKQNGKPILLFSGALAYWCDLELVEKLGKKYQVVVVGMPWAIEKIPDNIHYLGKKKYKELQAYNQHCDVSLLPFKRCQVSDFSNPIKMYEAMVFGKPTVSTDIPEAFLYPNAVLPSKNHKEFFENVERALVCSKDSDYQNKLIKLAQENTWEQRFMQIDQAIDNYFEQSGVDL